MTTDYSKTPPTVSRIRRALISVSDKTGVVELARFLSQQGVEIIATGGSAKVLSAAGIAVTMVAEITKSPEILGGRVKTLHPAIHGALLGIRGDSQHEADMAAHGIDPIDLVVANLYPFEAVAAANEADDAACVDNIDIGGPAMIRAAAKNHAFVTVVVHPKEYEEVMGAMRAHCGGVPYALRRRLAAAAFARVGAYDVAISHWFAQRDGENGVATPAPPHLVISGELRHVMRYGENPHQSAAFYQGREPRPGVACAKGIQGKQLSYNNFIDADAAFELCAEFENPACVIVKHANPCAVALGDSLRDAFQRAHACDRESAFGGVVAFNRGLDAAAAEEVAQLFLEVIIAPDVSEDARQILRARKNLRVLRVGGLPDVRAARQMVRSIAGGFLVQDIDVLATTCGDLQVVTKRRPDAREMQDMLFAFIVAKHAKSNAIVYAKDGMTVGMGCGQASRVNAARIADCRALQAAELAGEAESWAKGAVVASDAFFPFADGIEVVAKAGVVAAIQPGGSIRDKEVIQAADDRGFAMVFTGTRHFRH